jgi:hypothetical protein
MQEDEFEDLLCGEATEGEDSEPAGGTPCRLVGRFAPVQGALAVDCAAVTFQSTPRLRQLSVFLSIPTRSILACTTEGCAVSLAVQGMAGRGVSFEFNSASHCCQAALSLAAAGQMSEEELDAGTEEDLDREGGCSAVLDEVVLSSRFNFALIDGCRLLAWERCTCQPAAPPHGAAAPSPHIDSVGDISGLGAQLEPGVKTALAHASANAGNTEAANTRPVAGILYVCEGGLIFLPDRYCKCSSQKSLRAVATILPKPKCHAVRQVLGGLQVRGCWLGRRPCAQTRTGWAGGDLRAGTRDTLAFTLCFKVGLSKDFEALSHAAHALLDGNDAVLLDPQQRHKGSEAERARGKVWAKTYAQHSGHQLRSDSALRAAILGAPDGGGAAGPSGIPASCRAMMWLKLSGASEIAAAHAPQYAFNLLNHGGGAGGDTELLEHLVRAEMEINKDVHRTFAEADIRACLKAQVWRG